MLCVVRNNPAMPHAPSQDGNRVSAPMLRNVTKTRLLSLPKEMPESACASVDFHPPNGVSTVTIGGTHTSYVPYKV